MAIVIISSLSNGRSKQYYVVDSK